MIETDDGHAPEPSDCEIWPEHLQAFKLFMACSRHFTMVSGFGGSHWRATPPGDVRQVMDWQGIKRRDQGALWQQYQLMETEALRILNEREAAAARKAN